MINLQNCSKTAALLTERGVVLEDGKPALTDSWRAHCGPHLKVSRKEHAERQAAVRRYGASPDSTAFLGWVLLTDSWRHVRAEAVRALAQQGTEPGAVLIALGLADRSNLVVREAETALKRGQKGGLTAFLVLVALWEDQATDVERLQAALVTLAQRSPQPAMRQVLPRLEQEARKFFLLPNRRKKLRELIAALDQATSHLKDLPLTAQAGTDSQNLPLPTGTAVVAPEPRATHTRSGFWERLFFWRRD